MKKSNFDRLLKSTLFLTVIITLSLSCEWNDYFQNEEALNEHFSNPKLKGAHNPIKLVKLLMN